MIALLLIISISCLFGAAYGWFVLAGSKRIFFLFGTDGIIRILASAVWNATIASLLLLGPSFLVFEFLGLIPMKPKFVLVWFFALMLSSAVAKALRRRCHASTPLL